VAKTFLVGEKARKEAVDALSAIAEAVGTTLGPSGLPAILDKHSSFGGSVPVVTKDGVTTLQAMEFLDPIQNAVLSFAKNAANHAVLESGDGTTSSVVMAAAIAKAVLSESSKAPQAYAREIQSEINKCIQYVRANAIKSPDLARSVALTSCNGDVEIADAVMEAIDKVSAYGSILIEKNMLSKERYTIDRQEGYEGGRGYRWHPTLARSVNHISTGNAPFDIQKPYVFLYNGELHDVSQLSSTVAALSAHCGAKGFNLVCFAYDIWEDLGHKLIELNARYPNVKIFANKTKMSAEYGGGLQVLLDIAAITGATILDGGNYATATIEQLGSCGSIEVTPCKTVLKGRSPNNTIKERIVENLNGIEWARTDVDKDIIAARNAELSEGLVRIIVGGGHVANIQERADRVDDAVKAAQAALRSGVVPGCGVSYIVAAANSTTNKHVQQAATCVFSHIFKNHGTDTTLMLQEFLELASKKENQTCKIDELGEIHTGDFRELGVCDAAETVCAVLHHGSELGLLCATTGFATLTTNLDKLQDIELIRKVMEKGE
jgi:chaperonin GroEL